MKGTYVLTKAFALAPLGKIWKLSIWMLVVAIYAMWSIPLLYFMLLVDFCQVDKASFVGVNILPLIPATCCHP